jgi:hypothetical protein
MAAAIHRTHLPVRSANETPQVLERRTDYALRGRRGCRASGLRAERGGALEVAPSAASYRRRGTTDEPSRRRVLSMGRLLGRGSAL